jgi:hypothetical protein
MLHQGIPETPSADENQQRLVEMLRPGLRSSFQV